MTMKMLKVMLAMYFVLNSGTTNCAIFWIVFEVVFVKGWGAV